MTGLTTIIIDRIINRNEEAAEGEDMRIEIGIINQIGDMALRELVVVEDMAVREVVVQDMMIDHDMDLAIEIFMTTGKFWIIVA